MSKARKKPPTRKESRGRTYTISCTDEQWAAIQDGAERAGKKVSTWFVECALTVDPWPRKHRRLVLNEREQRRHARAVAASARNLGADEADGAGDVGSELRALMAARLRGMARRSRRADAQALLRRAFGDEAAQTVAADFLPDAPVKRLSILTPNRRAKLTPLSGTAEVVPVVNRGGPARLRVAPCAARSEAAWGVPVGPPGQPGRRHGRRRIRSGS